MLFPLLLCASSWAGPLHTGVPVNGIDGLGAPRFQTVDTGWMATVPGGFIRVYVGPTTSDAERWIRERIDALEAFNPTPNPLLAEELSSVEAHGDGKHLVLFRTENVALCSRNSVDAKRWAAQVRGAVVDLDIPWPTPPALISSEGRWHLSAPGAAHVAFVGGTPSAEPALTFDDPPYRVISWDGWGRAAWAEVAGPPTDVIPQ